MRTISKSGLPMAAAFMLSLVLTAQGVSASEDTTGAAADTDRPDTLEEQFASSDANGDGLLSRSEFSALEFKEGVFVEADTDGSGALDQSEFVKASSINERLTAKEFANDSWITTKVKAVLIKEDGLEGLSIGVQTKGGVVQLSGWVKTHQQMEKAQSLASQVKGVRRVENDLQIDG